MLIAAWPPVLGSRYMHDSMDGQLRSGTLRLFGLCFVYVTYLLLGAAVFSALEVPLVETGTEGMRAAKQQLLAKTPCLSGEFQSISVCLVLFVELG